MKKSGYITYNDGSDPEVLNLFDIHKYLLSDIKRHKTKKK